MTKSLICFVLFGSIMAFAQGCVYRFANQERFSSDRPRTIYIAPIADHTAHSGQASHLMTALKHLFARERSFIITDISSARWGVEVYITGSSRAITRVEKCDQGNEVLASGSIPCSQIKAENKLPDVSPEEEVATMSFRARAVDLSNGRVLFDMNLPNLSSGAYDLVGDGTVKASLSQKRELHLLRYFENSSRATQGLAQTAAQRIFDRLNAIPPP
ncbi:MAG: hypothetical protein RJB13_497, partial [Pseudomonadota bacterium]